MFNRLELNIHLNALQTNETKKRQFLHRLR